MCKDTKHAPTCSYHLGTRQKHKTTPKQKTKEFLKSLFCVYVA